MAGLFKLRVGDLKKVCEEGKRWSSLGIEEKIYKL